MRPGGSGKETVVHMGQSRSPGPRALHLRAAVAVLVLLVMLTTAGCTAQKPGSVPTADDPTQGVAAAPGMELLLPGIATGGALPRSSGAISMDGGKNTSPSLMWSGPVPAGTSSWALAMVDTTPPGRGFAHWLVLDIPASANIIPPGASGKDHMPKGSAELRNDAGTYGYAGPSPPSGTHTYVFVLYAMPDTKSGLGRGSSKDLFFKTVATALGQQTLRATYTK
jgi:Raf kinase inhibitor-like YbhB/YbcL family protein